MRTGVYILATSYQRAHLALFFIFAFCVPSVFAKTDVNQLMQLPGFKSAVITVAVVNKAMRDAAANPMDDWRRENVQIAIGKLPEAFRSLAGEFRSGHLKDGELSGVLEYLGGFADASFGPKAQQFLAKPSVSLIPEVGQGFPMQALAGASLNGEMASASAGAIDVKKSAEPKNEELVSLPAKDEVAGLTFDENASGAEAPKVATETENRFLQEAAGELTDSENRAPAAKSTAAESYKLKMKPEFWLIQPLGSWLLSSVKDVSAEQLDPNDPKFIQNLKDKGYSPEQISNIVAQIQQLQRDGQLPPSGSGGGQGSGGGGGGEGGGGGSSEARQILEALGAVTGEVSKMVVAAIEASAAKGIAKINADAQVTMTQIVADSTVKNGETLAKTSIETNLVMKDIAKNSQDATTERLKIQVGALDRAQQAAISTDDKRREMEREIAMKRLDLAQLQTVLTAQSADSQFQAMLLANGLGGTGTGGTGLVVRRRSGTSIPFSGVLTNARIAAGGSLLAAKPKSKVTAALLRKGSGNARLVASLQNSGKTTLSPIAAGRGIKATLPGGSTGSVKYRQAAMVTSTTAQFPEFNVENAGVDRAATAKRARGAGFRKISEPIGEATGRKHNGASFRAPSGRNFEFADNLAND